MFLEIWFVRIISVERLIWERARRTNYPYFDEYFVKVKFEFLKGANFLSGI